MKIFMNLKNENTFTENSNDINSYCINDMNIRNQQNDTNNFYSKNIIITIISNKGGVGKTSVAIAFAMFLSQKVRKRTLLLELDSSPGDFGTLFDIEKDKSMELALRFPEKYKEFVKNIYENIDVLKGVSNPLVAENIRKDSVNNLIDYISRDYKYIVIDTQTVINGPILDVLKLSNKIFIISEYSLESIARISKLIDILVRKFSIKESKIKLIVNKKKFIHFFKVWDISKVIEMPVCAFIKFDRGFYKNEFIFNKAGMLKTKFFKEIAKVLSMTIKGFDNNVKR